MLWYVFCFVDDLRWAVVVCFYDIGGIDDHNNTVWIITAIKAPVFVSDMYHCYLCQGQTTFNIFTMLAKKNEEQKYLFLVK